jgi:YidC/Oxa1 family membrane protein insertase
MGEILRPLELAVAWIMVAFHRLLTGVGMPAASGVTWALSIVGLVVVIRILLIPLFVKQIRASRALQLVQPEIQKIQKKYKGKADQESRQAMTKETMAAYKEAGTNPFSSCLPLLLQAPIFFALFRVLNNIPKKDFSIGPLTPELRAQADAATLLGAPLSDTFLKAETVSTQILTLVLIVLMSLSQFITSRQLLMKNMPASALDNPFARQQKLLMYVLPVVFAVTGVNFPIGVLIYWLTTNIWSTGQQFYVIRRMPAPGSLAAKALEERRARKGKGPVHTAGQPEYGTPEPPKGQRQQPKRTTRSKRTGKPRPGPDGPGPSGGTDERESGGESDDGEPGEQDRSA